MSEENKVKFEVGDVPDITNSAKYGKRKCNRKKELKKTLGINESFIFNNIYFKETKYKNYFVSKCGLAIKLSVYGIKYCTINKKHIYSTVNICRSNKLMHRLIAETFIKNEGNKPCVNHINGNKHDNNISNLEWVSYSENIIHSYKTLNRKPPHTELSTKEIEYILNLYNNGVSREVISNSFCIKSHIVNDICSYKNKRAINIRTRNRTRSWGVKWSNS